MTTVLGLDLSATKAGIALPTGRTITSRAPTINAAVKGADEIGRRLTWWHQELGHLLRIYRPQVVALEGPLLHTGGSGTIRVLEVHGIARAAVYRAGATLVEIAPAELKKWATGSGSAGKDDMIAAALDRGATPANDDEADAALLRFMVLETIGNPTDALARWLGAS